MVRKLPNINGSTRPRMKEYNFMVRVGITKISSLRMTGSPPGRRERFGTRCGAYPEILPEFISRLRRMHPKSSSDTRPTPDTKCPICPPRVRADWICTTEVFRGIICFAAGDNTPSRIRSHIHTPHSIQGIRKWADHTITTFIFHCTMLSNGWKSGSLLKTPCRPHQQTIKSLSWSTVLQSPREVVLPDPQWAGPRSFNADWTDL